MTNKAIKPANEGETLQPARSPAQRRHEQLRRRLFDEAGRLFEEYGGEEGGGFELTTVDAIAARADISTRTFFRYFESKADVIYLDLKRSMEEYFLALDQRLEKHDALTAAVLARIDQISAFSQEPLNVKRLLRALRSKNFVNRRASWYAELQDKLPHKLIPYISSDKDASLHAALIAALVVKIGEMGLLHWSKSEGSDDPAASIARVYLWYAEMFDSNGDVMKILRDQYGE